MSTIVCTANVDDRFLISVTNHGTLSEEEGPLGRGGIHLTKQGKGIFASKRADMIVRT